MHSVYSTLTASRQLCDSLDLCLGMPTYGGLLNKQGAVRTASDVAPCYRRVTAVLCLWRTCETSTERILMKVTAMESSQRRLHHRTTQGERSRAVWPAQCKMSAETGFGR